MSLRRTAFALIVLLSAGQLFAQSNRAIDTLLSQEKAVYAETAYLALLGGGWIGDNDTPAAAFTVAMDKGWIPRTADLDTPIDLRSFAKLTMKGLRIKGGFAWTLLQNKRYAYRELLARGIINATGGANRIPSGEEVVRMIGKAADLPRRAR
jgi:hypothetical protein